jgi:hypothetical protein
MEDRMYGVTLKWLAEEVEILIAITKAAKKHKKSYGKKTGPSLWFVKDQGIYLMSSRTYEQGETPASTGEVYYAQGYGKDADWDKIREAVGGDDFCQTISLRMLTRIPENAVHFCITVHEDELEFGWETVGGQK